MTMWEFGVSVVSVFFGSSDHFTWESLNLAIAYGDKRYDGV